MTMPLTPDRHNVVPFPGGLHAGWPTLERMVREAMNGYRLDEAARQGVVDRMRAFYTETLQVHFTLPINLPIPGPLTAEQDAAIRVGMRDQIVKPLEDAVDAWSRNIFAERFVRELFAVLDDPHPRAA